MTQGTTRVEGPSGIRRRTLTSGETLHAGRFRIEEELGSGGEGVVYSARDTQRETTVALKTLHLNGTRSTSAIKREFRLLRGLIHPGLVHLHELFVDADYAFFSMTYVPGRAFNAVDASYEQLRSSISQLADVLGFLHRAGRVHRDVKPSNVIVQEDGRAVLVDFGVALDLTRDAGAQDAGIGTPLYMAPEVRMGKPATPKSDAYAVGVMLFERLTGKHPFLRRRVGGEMMGADARASRLAPEVPPDLDQVCADLLRFEPEERIGVEEVVERLVGRDDSKNDEASGAPSVRTRLIGRREQSLRLDEAYNQMLAADEPVVVHIEGGAGLGKSALVDAFLDGHESDATILSGRCVEQEYVCHKAFDGVMDDLAARLSQLDESDVIATISREEARVLVPLFPQLSQVKAIRHLIPEVDPGNDPQYRRNQGYEALAVVLSRLADERPLIVSVDALQWGDLDSARLLYHVFAGAVRPRCLLLLSYRVDRSHRSACLDELLRGRRCLADELRSSEVHVGRLSHSETTELIADVVGSEELARRWMDPVWQAAGGSPLLVTELALYLAERRLDDMPNDTLALEEIVERRLSQASPPARQLFESICCSGAGLPVWVAERLQGADVGPLMAELRALRLGHPEEAGSLLHASHDAARAAGERLMGDRARQVHRRLAEIYEERGAQPAVIARHHAAGDCPEQTGPWAERAAIVAAEALAFEQAAQLYRLALEHYAGRGSTPYELQVKLAQALADAGHGTEAAPLYLELAKTAPASDALRFRCRAAQQWLVSGDIQRGHHILSDVLDEVGLRWPKTPLGAMVQLGFNRALLKLASDDDHPLARGAIGLSQSLRFEACHAAWSVGYVSTIHGAANTATYLRMAKRSGDAEHLANGYGMDSLYRASMGTAQRPLVEDYRRRAEHWMPEPRTMQQQAFLQYVGSQGEYLLGNFKVAVDAYAAAEGLLKTGCRGVAWEMNSSRIFWASVLYYLGRHLEMDRRMAVWLEDAHEREDTYCSSALRIMHARRVGMPDGHWDEAYEQVRAGMAEWNSPYFGVHATYEALFMGHAALCQGRPEVASDLMRQLQRNLLKAQFHRVLVVRVFQTHYEAFGEIGQAWKVKGSQRRRHVVRARKLAKRLLVEDLPFATGWAYYVLGACHHLEENEGEAVSLFEQAASVLSEEGFALHAGAVHLRIAHLVGGDRGRSGLASSRRVFAKQEIRDIAGALHALAPGPEI